MKTNEKFRIVGSGPLFGKTFEAKFAHILHPEIEVSERETRCWFELDSCPFGLDDPFFRFTKDGNICENISGYRETLSFDPYSHIIETDLLRVHPDDMIIFLSMCEKYS
jgi:hypothetical protein